MKSCEIKKKVEVVMKIDIGKAYDRVRWELLETMLIRFLVLHEIGLTL